KARNRAMQEMAHATPHLLGFLGEASRAHCEGVCRLLADAGIEYRLNPRLVRGLDYYNMTVFGWVTDRLGAQGTVCGGGRYDGLTELPGGEPAPAVGFAIGVERLLDLWSQAGEASDAAECDVYVVHQGEAASRRALQPGETLRDAGLDVIVHAGSASFKSQMKRADASKAEFAVILGDNELAGGQATVKALADGSQRAV